MSQGHHILLDRITEKLIFLQLISNFALNQKDIINDKGELLPCLNSNYLAFSNSLRLDIQAFYALDMIGYETGDEDVTVATKTASPELAETFKEASETHAKLPVVMEIDDQCG